MVVPLSRNTFRGFFLATLIGILTSTASAFLDPPSIRPLSRGILPHRSSSSFQLQAIQTHLDDDNYHAILNNEDGKAVLVDACAPWCGPCKLIEPFLMEMADKHSQQLHIVKWNVEAKNIGALQVECLLQGVMPKALPHLILFQDGKAIATHTGALTRDELDEFLQEHLSAQHRRKPKTEISKEADAAEETSSRGYISLGGMGQDDYMLSG